MSSLANAGLARYACDYCKQKKFRCSKEFPKCSACKPWPGPCSYSRDKPALKVRVNEQTTRPSLGLTDQRNIEGLHERLRKVEEAVQALTNAVTQAVDAINHPSTNCQRGSENDREPHEAIDLPSNLSVGDVDSFSFIKDTSITNATVGSSPLYQHAAKELQYLSHSLIAAVASKEHPSTGFYIPSRAEGYQMIGHFLENASLGDAFFITPSEDLLIQTIFRPETVSRKAWVVYINYMILTMLVDNENAKAQKYRNNMKLALNDSRIFLEPHEVNLQALVMLAIHGEDYASPNSSWMLIGHACRQAEALGFPIASTADYVTTQRRLSLFWLLFAMIGTVVDSRHIPEPEEGLRERLGEWYTRTNKQILEDTLQNERAFSGPNELREMVLGISTIKFEYLHVLMVLLKSHPPSASLRLEAAREAISLLPSMVSNWTSVYNSMIWHLLYFPFTPYFIIFENLVQRNALLRKVMIQQDLELLSTTVSYYSSMTRQMQMLAPLCARLKNIATVFLHLAKLHTDCSDPLYSTQPPAPEPLQSRSSQNQKTSISANSTSTGSLQTELGGECDVDLEQYLQWLPSDVIPLQDTQSTDIPDEDSNQRALGAEVVKPLQAEPRGTKRPFDVMFDWFAWDVYYGEQNIEIG
ncbi:hypothetical protein FOIG_02510 [Fusarium odoratissimum NRRL 54006]|uniref:Zn(2)-C6 fungal-type domain-containing protein n=1 Tax=Fusarium odoratissimum (strain NRRL 54006) TaxID=1089451 RepID=X0K1T5_FUSO5|nr:uncharacterized protein FOIG_02510 [Fusarium odoratissimum NRRL 54006]EXM07504.1 hypothetical protein FOIG_02510 [Fusarium odoratissimum NRRL 54006]